MAQPTDARDGQPGRGHGAAGLRARRRALKVAGIYAACGLLWIALSDRVLASFIPDSGTLTTFQTYKGWAFVLTTAALVFVLSRRALLEPERLAARVRASESRFRALFENMNAAALVIDPGSGGILDANEAAAAFYGWPRERLRLMNIAGINTLEPGELRRRMDEVERGRQASFVCRHRRADGTVRDVEVYSGPIPFEGRTALYSIVHDVTGRKTAEEALRESEQRFRDLAESLPLTVFEMDLQGRFTYVNTAAFRTFGYDREDAGAGLCMPQMIAPADRERALEVMARRLAGETRGHVEYQGLRKDGSTFPITVASSPVLRDGRPVGLRGIVTDLSERKQLEQELLRAEKLESIGTLAGGIAHDFNNLLQGVFGYLSMAKLTYDQRDRSLAMLTQAEEALHRSVGLTAQLLTFSKGGKPVKKTVALAPIIEGACRFALSGSRTTCRIESEPDLWTVEADEGQIGQVVQNIVLNADQAMPLGGTVSVRMKNVPEDDASVREPEPGKRVEITIRDSGVGIPAEYLPKIFDPYFTTKDKGSGLGLATSYSIVKGHGGTIAVASEPGKGTTFTIVLPAVDLPAEPLAPAAGSVRTRRGRVLVMDDDEVIRRVATELVSSLGHEVETAENGEQAVERYRGAQAAGRPFDVVILDLTIRGGMGGAEAVQLLREIDPGVKAVVSSGYSDDPVTSNYREHGFRSYLQKPYTAEGLRAVLSELLA